MSCYKLHIIILLIVEIFSLLHLAVVESSVMSRIVLKLGEKWTSSVLNIYIQSGNQNI